MEGEITSADLAALPEQDKKAEEKKDKLIEKLKAKQYDIERENKILKDQLEKARAEKREPGITAINSDGNRERRKRVNSTGLSDLVLPPYTKNQIATYRIIGADDINPATGLPVMPVDTLIPGEYLFHDKYETDIMKRDKIRRNVVGTKTVIVDGKPETQEQVEDIVFSRGWLHVPVSTKYPLYVFIELHPMHKGNKHRPNNYPAVFERTDLKYNSPAAQAASLELSVTAGKLVMDMKKDDVIAYALTCKPPIPTAGRQIHEIRTDLMRIVMANPVPFYKQNKDEKAGILINVSDAIAFGILEYQNDQKSFVLTETEEIVFTHSVQEEPTSGLVKFLSKDENGKYYDAILDRLNYWGND